jgi:hypothetical protein
MRAPRFLAVLARPLLAYLLAFTRCASSSSVIAPS